NNWPVHEGFHCGVIVEQVDPAGFALGLVYNPDLPAQPRYVRDGLSIGQVFSLIRGPRPVELVVDLQDFGRHVFPPLMVYSYLPFMILPLCLHPVNPPECAPARCPTVTSPCPRRSRSLRG